MGVPQAVTALRISIITAMDSIPDEQLAWDKGPLPCVVQDWRTGEVLTVAYMDREALRRTLESGEIWFWSRSRQELWHKGATSGNIQRVRGLRWDCDADALLAQVEPAGPACHTGERTCFHNGDKTPSPGEAIGTLERTVAERAGASTGDSYTARLLGDAELRSEKVREEAEEVTRAAAEESDERVAEEAADLVYHLDVLLAARGLSLADAFQVLNDRRR